MMRWKATSVLTCLAVAGLMPGHSLLREGEVELLIAVVVLLPLAVLVGVFSHWHATRRVRPNRW